MARQLGSYGCHSSPHRLGSFSDVEGIATVPWCICCRC